MLQLCTPPNNNNMMLAKRACAAAIRRTTAARALCAPSTAGVGLGCAAALYSSGAADGLPLEYVQAWLPSPASLVGEPTASCVSPSTTLPF